jgi:tetratricopeptide (TPR) repeat protein
MFGIFRNILTILILLSLNLSGWSTPADEPSEMLARAEALYYEADFAKSIELLLRADTLLRQQSGRLQDKINVRLQLALGFIGLNDTARAKAYLSEMFAIDENHRIDPQMFSPKVIQLAEEAKAEQAELRCRSTLDEAQRLLGAGNANGVVKLIVANQAKCSGLAALYPKTADLLFKEGLNAYKKANTAEALEKFRAVLALDPKHELAAEYVELTQRKLEITADRALLAWRKDFNAGEFESAARDYRELMSVSASETVDEIRTEYRQALSILVDSWNRACANNDAARMEDVRAQVNAMLPEPSFAQDILTKMTVCKQTGCVQMSSQQVLARLRTRVDPQFPAHVISQIKGAPATVRVKARINETGSVASSEVQDGNPLLYSGIRAAFELWKFSPAVVEGESRCIETTIPIVISVK